MSPSASGPGQPSILSFFHKQQQPPQPPKYAAPPPSSRDQAQSREQPEPSQTAETAAPPPPQAPPLPPQPPLAIAAAAAAVAPATTIPSPHPSATILPVTEAHIPALRRINALLLPVNYTDGFYTALLDPAVSGLFSRTILWQDDRDPAAPPKVVGGLVCRLEPSPFDAATGRYSADLAKRGAASAAPPRGARALYIQSLVLLAPYRGLGLAAAALEGVSSAAVAGGGGGGGGNPRAVEWVYAHVWTDNEDGLAWYGRRGFERDAVLERYYWKLRPDSAWVVKRRVGAAAAAAGGARQQHQDAHELPAAVPASVTAAAVNMPGFASAVTPPPPAPTSAPPAPSAANNGPPRGAAAGGARPPPPASSLSFQNKRPNVEWNDLPEDMMMAAATASKNSSRSDLLAPPSGSSSRSSSTGRKKRDRAYPTAAFGS